MTLHLLIQAIVRQTTILIAQLATSRGSRAPLAQVADQVFQDLVHELERQGVSRKVSADMFGLGLRTYQRKVQRLTESKTSVGRSLWMAVLDYLTQHGRATRADIFKYFAAEDESLVRGVLHDLCESGLVTATGSGNAIAYECISDSELERLSQLREDTGFDELLWALLDRQGSQTFASLVKRYGTRTKISAALERLGQAGRVTFSKRDGRYSAEPLALPLGSPVGWEAGIFDHFQAMVKTINCRLRLNREAARLEDRIGGSTFTFEVWPGHPHEAQAYATLSSLRTQLVELRSKIEGYNAEHAIPENYTEVSLYVGQCLVPQGSGDIDDHP